MPNKAIQPTVLPPLRFGKPAAELGRFAHHGMRNVITDVEVAP
jgi:hypothetical protein